jgi:hypothetical protein
MTALIGSGNTNSTTLITVPDGYRTWTGYVTLSAAQAAAVNSGITTAFPNVTIEGNMIYPATGAGTVVAEIAVATPIIDLLGLLSAATSNAGTFGPIEITTGASGTGDATLVLNTASVSAVSAVATGDLQ